MISTKNKTHIINNNIGLKACYISITIYIYITTHPTYIIKNDIGLKACYVSITSYISITTHHTETISCSDCYTLGSLLMPYYQMNFPHLVHLS